MAPETKMRAGMTSRQIIVAVILVIVLIVIIWQFMGLFSGGTPTPPKANIVPTAKPQNTMAANAPVGNQPAPANQPMAPQMNAPSQLPPNSSLVQAAEHPTRQMPPQVQLKESAVEIDNELLQLQKETEQRFIEQLNQLQMLKVQREIAETNQAIAAARLATVTSEKNVSDLLTRPSQTPQIPPGAYAAALVNPATTAAPLPLEEEAPPPPPEVQYVVISVSMQFGRWNAVVGSQGKLFNVSIGDVLPDGSVVASISRSGVVLVKDNKRKKVSIISSV